MRPAALHLTDIKQWRKALAAGPLTNAVRGGKPKGKRSASPAKGAPSAGASTEPEAPRKVLRAAMYSPKPDGPVPWPPTRLRGSHRLGWHPTGSRSTNCDYPGCCDVEKTCDNKEKMQAGSAGGRSTASTPDRTTMPPPPPRSSGGGSSSSRAPSPTPSDASSCCSTTSTRGGVTKMYCKDCYDPSDTRPMNFHAECWNLWHSLCDECDE